jgi:hypothetical protein
MKKFTPDTTGRDPIPACAYCEFACALLGDEMFVNCTRGNREVSKDGLCGSYIYDLLKRQPTHLSLTSHLAPDPTDD